MEDHWMYLLSAVIQAVAIAYAWVLAMYMYLLRGVEARGRSWEEDAVLLNIYTKIDFDDEVEKIRQGIVPAREEVVRLIDLRLGLKKTRDWLDNVGRALGGITVLGTIIIACGMFVLGYPIDNGWVVWTVVGMAVLMFGSLAFVTLVVLNISYAKNVWVWFKRKVLRKGKEGDEVPLVY